MPSTPWQRTTPKPDRNSWTWQQARKAALARDNHRCTALLPTRTRCTTPAHEVDHIAQGNNHSLSNLASLCTEHHKQKTNQEKTAARWKYHEKREQEQHPGLKH